MTAPSPFAGRLRQEGHELYAAAAERQIDLRLMGGVGIRLLIGDTIPRLYDRPYRDLDIIVRRRQRRDVETLLSDRSWEPATAFNALSGGRRLLFHDPASDAQVDVFVETFEMCHTLPLADGLNRPGPSLPATDLLMSKLQIVELNAKDRNDCYALLERCDVADGDHRALEPSRIAGLTSVDWGLHHTFELNFQRLREGLKSVPEADAARITAVLDALAAAIEQAPKGRGWKLRARIGERKRWYEEPEEVDRTPPGG
ncbi:MAG TPA: hypothetical protein VG365_01875 [Solirubrobacteraceae bacterium]|nr:hypothetical protein [Solirubrobacteraceae bacterium]